ncbi:hypothetical protein KY319_01725 [Candidatus Woesearchaeota archaeon]|nr:hypothetical protein [Candidatus Woesearchaeota archaeon]
MDSHTAGIYGVLIAVVVVGVVGLYFTTMMANETEVVYVGAGYAPQQITAWTPPFYSKIASISKPFIVKGRGVTGLSAFRQGTASINTSKIFDLRMPKNIILCNATLFQDNDSAILYTCGDNVSFGGAIQCDDGSLGGTGNSITNPTTNNTCNSTQNNGAFLVCNHGSVGQLNATVLNITVANVTNYNIWLDNILYNGLDNDPSSGGYLKGCNGTCNNCNKTQADAGACDKSLNASVAPASVLECDFFDTSGQCVCECFSIHIDNLDDVHLLKSGETLEFVVKKTIETTSLNVSTQCT